MPRKTDLVTFLDRELYKDDIVSVAEKQGLPTKGNKVDLIKELVSKTTPKKLISEFFLVGDLKEILDERGLPISGSKDELVNRVLSLIEAPKAKKEITEQKKKKTVIVNREKSFPEGVANYLKNTNMGSIKLKDESDLERYLFGKLEEFFKEGNIKLVSQAIGIKDRSRPDITVKKGKETVVVELKYIRKQADYENGITQAQKYSGIIEGAKVVLFCYDPERKIKQEIPHISEVISIIK